MPVEHIVRGNMVDFAVTFQDAGSPGTQPNTAAIRVVFPSAARGQTETAEIPLAKDESDIWRGSWDSREAGGPGVVIYWARCNGSFIAATEGSFQLYANVANSGT